MLLLHVRIKTFAQSTRLPHHLCAFSHFTLNTYVVDTYKGSTSVSAKNNDETTIKQVSHFL